MEKILRIKQPGLYLSGNKYQYNGIIFTGIMYVQEGEDIQAYEVENGEVVREYSNELMGQLYDDPSSFVDVPGEKPRELHDGQPYSGRFCHFDHNYCVEEEMFHNGLSVLVMAWYPDGGLKLYERRFGKIRARFEFYENGAISDVQLDEFDNMADVLSLVVTVNGRLLKLNLSKEYSTILNKIAPDLPFSNPATNEALTDYKFDNYVTLSGNGLGKEFFELMVQKKCLAETSNFSARVKSFEKSHLKEIGSLPQLKELIIEDGVGDLANELLQIKEQRPDLEIKYNFVLE